MGSVPRKKAPRNSNKGGVKASKGAAVEVDSSSTEVQGVDLDDEEEEEEDEDEYLEDFEDEIEDEDDSIVENDAFIDDMLEEEGEGVDDIQLGDGGDGGGVRLSKTAWGQKALDIAKGVLEEFGSNFELYAFKVSPEGRVYVRLDKLSDKYGSPSVVEIESFSTIYGKRLEEAGQEGDIPNNLALEVSSPGAERVVEVPNQLLRFKDLPMFVKYVEANDPTDSGALAEKDGVLELESVEIEAGKTLWKIANVRFNRDQAGKGRGLTKKQKEWRAEVPLSSLRLVRLHMDI